MIFVNCKFYVRCVVALVFLFLRQQLLFTQPFIEQTTAVLPSVTNSSIAWGDYDNNGTLDILLTGANDAGLISKIYSNNGNNTFSELPVTLTGVTNGSVAWGDYNNDGYLDILLTGSVSNTEAVTKIYRNNGDSTFSETGIVLPGVNNGSVAWGDYDNDGYLDILLTGYTITGATSISKIYHNNGNNTFTESGISLTGVLNGNAVWGDYDNDGYLDIVMTGSGVTKIYRNNGSGTFTEQSIALLGLTDGNVAWGDYNNDGYLDILLHGKENEYSVVYRNNGNNTFTALPNVSSKKNQNGSSAWGDYDNDGYLDILITGKEAGLDSKVFRNNHDSTFTEVTGNTLAEVEYGCGIWGDYDNDGKLDILLTGLGITKLYRNNGSVSNTSALGPANLQTTINGPNVTFTWDKATDTETLQNGLSYNLYVYEDGQTTYKRTPHAFRQSNENNGHRLIAQIGNIQYSSAGYTLKNLPLSTYKWSIQAVDAGLKGGSFTTEASFSSTILSNVGVNVANGQITNTTTLMSYSLNSTDGINGTWTLCTTPNTNVDFGTGGFDVWVHANGLVILDKRKVASIAPQAAAPTYTIDYGNEITNQNVATTDEYAVNAYMIGASNGSGLPISVTPGQNLFFRTKATTSAVASAIQTLVAANRPATPTYTIDFINEATNEIVPETNEYLVGSGVVVIEFISGTGVKIAVTPGQTIYFRVKASITTFKSLVQTLIVPNRPATPIYSIDFINETTSQNVTVTDEYSVNSGMSPAFNGAGVKIAVSPGQNLYFRVKATDLTFKSLAQTLTVPNRSTVPVYSINYSNETTNENIAVTNEYSADSSMSLVSSGAGVKITVTPGQNLYFRVKATISAFKSLVQTLTVPSRPVTPVYSADMVNETTKEDVSTTDEYSVNLDMSGAVSGTGVKISVIPGRYIYFRVKSTTNSFKSFIQTLIVPHIFSEQTGISLAGVTISSAAWGDYNNDGYLDILLTGIASTGSAISRIYKNNGDNTFTEQTGISLIGVSDGSVAWGDYDNDGYLDILLTGWSGSADITKIYRNNGDGSFTEQTSIILPGVSMSSVAWGDCDNNGFLDILLTGSSSKYISKIFYNNGNNTFTELPGFALTGVYNSSVAWGDYDNDGNLDILLTGDTGSARVSKIYRNNGNNTFTEQTGISLSLIGVSDGSVAWGDYDNDGYLDIALTGASGVYPAYNLVSKIYHNEKGLGFTELAGTQLTGVYNSSVVWGDYNNDGYLDILLTGRTGSVGVSKVYRNTGNSSFTEQSLISLPGLYYGCAVWGDYDNDDNLDILLTGTGSLGRISKVYHNNRGSFNNAASVPGNLQYTLQNGNIVTFTWAKSADNETPQDGLSYNFYVYEDGEHTFNRTPAAFTQTQPNNGHRLITQLINIQYNENGYTLKNLPTGSYKWSVQAIDGGLKGGSFAVEASFQFVNLSITKVNVAYNQITNTINAMEYSINSADGINGIWVQCMDANTSLNFGKGGFDVWVRQINYPANCRKIATIPAQASAPSYTIDYIKETTNETFLISDEYSLYADMSETINGNGKQLTLTPGQNLYFRTKATDSTVSSGIQLLVVPNRPPMPAYTINYVGETTYEPVSTLDEYSFNLTMSNPLTGTGAKIPVIPDQNLYFRTKPSSMSFCSNIQILIVKNRPAAPTNPSVNDILNTFDWTSNPLFNSISDYEFSVDSGNLWINCVEKPINIGNVNIDFGILQVRIKADTGNFRSGVVYSNDVYTTINTGINDFKRTNITLYPNPVNNIIIIDKLTENTEVSIYSLNGVLVKAVYLNNTNKIAVNDLPNGIYILKLQGNKIKGETKFIKQ